MADIGGILFSLVFLYLAFLALRGWLRLTFRRRVAEREVYLLVDQAAKARLAGRSR